MSLQHPLEIEQILQQEQDFAGRVVELIIFIRTSRRRFQEKWEKNPKSK